MGISADGLGGWEGGSGLKGRVLDRNQRQRGGWGALVHGRFTEERGRIEEPLARDRTHRTRMAVVRGGREAVTLWRARRTYDRFTLLDVKIKTGRTHQIRVHLAWLKHPVVGDETYNAGRDRAITDSALRARVHQVGRQFLHAERLAFNHPRTAERLLFTAPLPPELQSFLDWLEEQAAVSGQ